MATEFNEKQFAFKAWIEKTDPDGTVKLHVHGQIEVEDETLLYQLDKKSEQGYFPEELFLIIKPDPIPGSNTIAIKYHENLANKDRYKRVTILVRTGQTFEINEIGLKE